jgi:hypothetical protein
MVWSRDVAGLWRGRALDGVIDVKSCSMNAVAGEAAKMGREAGAEDGCSAGGGHR